MMGKLFGKIAMLALMVIVSCVFGCGGSSPGTTLPSASAKTITGVAAAGSPITGTVYLKDSSNPAVEKTQTINPDGSFSFDVTGLTAPFLLKAVGTANGQSYTLYSLAGAPGIANINPLSHLAVVQANGGADPAALYASLTPSQLQAITTAVAAVVPQIKALLQQILAQYGCSTVDFIAAPYTANHSGLDLMFDMILIDVANGTLTISNKVDGTNILTTSLTGSTLSGQITAANIPVISVQAVGTVYAYPSNTTVAASGTSHFKAVVIGTASQNVTWSVVEAGGGSVTAAGVYTAPVNSGTYHVKAANAADESQSSTITVNVVSSGGSSSSSNSGKEDPAFGNNGVAVFDATSNYAELITSVKTVQTNKTLGLGIIGTNTYIICQLTDSGTLDTTFGAGGYVTPTTSGIYLTGANSLEVLPNGKFVIAGSDSNSSLAIIRFNADGSPDTTFGNGGKASMAATGFAVTKLIYDSVNQFFYLIGGAKVARITSAGSLDTSFGTNGIVTCPSSFSYLTSGALQPDGKLVVVGAGSGGTVGVARYTTSGGLDATFGIGGTVTTNPSSIQNSNAQANDVAILANGKILVTGNAKISGSYSSAVIVRYNAGGTLDTSFGTSGVSSVAFGAGSNNIACSAAVQSDGKIVVSGAYAYSGSCTYNYQYNMGYGGIARVNGDGSIDTTFAANGSGFLNNIDMITSVSIRSDGKIAGGGRYYSSGTEVAFIRFMP